MRAWLLVGPLAVLLVTGCSTVSGGTHESPQTAVASGTPSPTAIATERPGGRPTSTPTAVASPPPVDPTAVDSPPATEPVTSTTYTQDDEEIARLVSAGADIAIAQLRGLNDSDPSKLEDVFLPLGEWIKAEKAAVEALTPSSCTTDAVASFEEGIDAYDDIRQLFLAWRDWGAIGHAFPPGAPRQAADLLRAAVAELDAHCSP